MDENALNKENEPCLLYSNGLWTSLSRTILRNGALEGPCSSSILHYSVSLYPTLDVVYGRQVTRR